MKKNLLIASLFLFQFALSQNQNIILQVNDKILTSEIANMYVRFNNESEKHYNLRYYPGDLIFSKELLIKINQEQKFYLYFDYYTYENGKQKIANFDIELNAKLFEQPYLIINVYDFRDRVYKRRYRCLTNNDYLVELRYPNSGLWVHCK